MNEPVVLLESEGHVRYVTLNRPSRLNAMSQPLIDSLAEVLESVHADPTARVLVLRGAGRGFCAGADLDHNGFEVRDGQARLEMFRLAYRIPRLLHGLPIPIVTAVNGAVAGAGLSLVAAADIAIASTDAFFKLNFIRLGLLPDMGLTASLPYILGPKRALEMALTDERISAEEARISGLVSRLVAPEDLPDETRRVVDNLLALPPLAVRNTKRLMLESTKVDFLDWLDTEMQEQNALHETRDLQEGLRAFREKRAPVFTGE
jgi:2-(1,2-epoxy-1,2-dihydrophenyl)acetyl-CoA isomerase